VNAIGVGRSTTLRILIGFIVYILFAWAAQAGTPSAEASPQNDGIPAKALELLAGRVQALVDNEEIVGGELVVIKDRRTVFRQAFGWKDRESEQPLEIDSIYCVRSMTKPFVGTAIQMLIDEDRLRLDTPVHEILPFFAGPETGKITVEHLLTHTGGFPFTTISRPLSEYAELADIAAEAAKTELGFEPGTRFEYSDAGSDTLGAIVAKITGAPVEQFIQQRILDPLEMEDTHYWPPSSKDDRRAVLVVGGEDDLDSTSRRPLKAAEEATLTRGASGLYSTAADYWRFCQMLLNGGELNGERLLGPAPSRGSVRSTFLQSSSTAPELRSGSAMP
jgi:CubicO group peptidase (beta-lactamase class C family)